MGIARKMILSVGIAVSMSACQAGGAQPYRLTNGSAAFEPTVSTVTVKGIRKSPAGDIPVEALYAQDTIRGDLGKGAIVTVGGRELQLMALKAFSTIDACREQIGVSFVGQGFLNTALRQAAGSLGDDNARLRNEYLIEMRKPGACAALASQLERDAAVNIFLDPPVKPAAPVATRRP